MTSRVSDTDRAAGAGAQQCVGRQQCQGHQRPDTGWPPGVEGTPAGEQRHHEIGKDVVTSAKAFTRPFWTHLANIDKCVELSLNACVPWPTLRGIVCDDVQNAKIRLDTSQIDYVLPTLSIGALFDSANHSMVVELACRFVIHVRTYTCIGIALLLWAQRCNPTLANTLLQQPETKCPSCVPFHSCQNWRKRVLTSTRTPYVIYSARWRLWGRTSCDKACSFSSCRMSSRAVTSAAASQHFPCSYTKFHTLWNALVCYDFICYTNSLPDLSTTGTCGVVALTYTRLLTSSKHRLLNILTCKKAYCSWW